MLKNCGFVVRAAYFEENENIAIFMVTCSHSIKLRISLSHSLVTRVLPQNVSGETLALTGNISATGWELKLQVAF